MTHFSHYAMCITNADMSHIAHLQVRASNSVSEEAGTRFKHAFAWIFDIKLRIIVTWWELEIARLSRSPRVFYSCKGIRTLAQEGFFTYAANFPDSQDLIGRYIPSPSVLPLPLCAVYNISRLPSVRVP